jgi:sugar lactone lactonase YvrE
VKRPLFSRRNILCALGALFAILIGYLLLWPVSIDPAPWSPPEPPSTESGIFETNSRLRDAKRLPIGGIGPEDVAVDRQGRIYGGLVDGRIMRLKPDGTRPTQFAHTGGRPLGLHFDGRDNLIVADAVKGLLSIDPKGKITSLAKAQGEVPFGFADDVDVAPDGIIYFSDASSRWGVHHYREDVMEHRPHGRLLAYDPKTKKTRLVVDKLFFANGVAVSHDGTYVLVNETTTYRVKRHWLAGPRRGKTEVFIDNLPGFPDGISAGRDGLFWIAVFSPRVKLLDRVLPSPWLRKVIYRLPRFLQPDPVRHGIVLAVDGHGRVKHNLQDPSADSYSPVTSVQQHGDMLYLGSLSYPGIARIAVP